MESELYHSIRASMVSEFHELARAEAYHSRQLKNVKSRLQVVSKAVEDLDDLENQWRQAHANE